MIVIRTYDPSWPQQFERIRAELTAALLGLALRIDHIGSTSVPGLGAKDVIDVQVTVRTLSAEVRERLMAAGYRHRAALVRDHVPVGENDAPDLWAKLVFTERAGERRSNIHVRAAGAPNQRYALLFRDYLRAHPNSVGSVERIKRELARRHADDAEAYYAVKDPAYDLVWDAARAWAEATGWSAD